MHFKRFFFLFVAISFALYCASFSVFAEEITSTFDFTSAVLERLIILNSSGEIINTENRGVEAREYSTDCFIFPYALSSAYDPSIPGDLVCGQVRFSGEFSNSMSPGYTYDYVKVSYSFQCLLSTGFDDITNDAFLTNVYLDLLDGSEFRRFDEYTLTIHDQSRYTLSFYGEIPDNNTFDYLRCTVADVSFPLSFMDYVTMGESPNLYLNYNNLKLTYIESVDTGGGDPGGGDTGGGDTGGGDTGGGDTGGGTDSSDIVIIVSRLDNLETILQDIGSTADSIESKIVIQNQLISNLPGNIANELANKDLGSLPQADHHEDEIGQVEELEDKFYDVVDDFKENISSSMNTANTVIRDNTDNISSGSGLFLTRVFDLSFVRTIVLVSLSFGFIGYLFRLGGKVL